MATPPKKRMNQEIEADRVFVIDHDGEKLGEMSIYEALRRAEEGSMDLVEVAPGQDGLVICKIIDEGKELFKKKKNQQKSKASGRIGLKTLRISYKMADHDLDVRRKQAEKFANQHHLLRIELILRGRERRFSQEAMVKFISFIRRLEDVYTSQAEPKLIGNRISNDLRPVKK